MADARVTNPLVEQFRRGGVARDLRLMAAQGLLPLKPEDLLELWTDLLRDADADVRSAAEKSLLEFPAAELLPVLKGRDASVPVLAWAVARRAERELREAALQNTSLPDEAIESLAPSLSEALAELVVINQTRLLRRTSLLVALESNPGLSNDQRRRLRELRETFRVGAAAEPAPAAAPVPEPPPEPPPGPPPAAAGTIRVGASSVTIVGAVGAGEGSAASERSASSSTNRACPSAAAKSAADRKRSSGRFAIAVATIASSCGGTSEAMARAEGTGSVIWAWIVEIVVGRS